MARDQQPPDPPAAPTVYLIAGPNGAGKTTFSTSFLPDFVQCREFLNADLIAAGLSPFAPETQNVRAGRLLLERIQELTEARVSFAFETTLAGRAYSRRLAEMRSLGYRVSILFLYLPSVEMALTRVANRVLHGGHSIPPADIRRRYAAGLRNLFQIYQANCDAWWLYDASEPPPRLIATEVHGQRQVLDSVLYQQAAQSAGQRR